MNRTAIETALRHYAVAAVCAGVLFMLSCSPASTVDGGGTRGGNPVVTGSIVGTDGVGVGDVRVSLIFPGFDPLTDTPIPASSTDTTDAQGKFTITAPDSGHYNIEAVGILGGGRLITFDIIVYRDSVHVMPPDTLHAPGTIVLSHPQGHNLETGYVYIPGTTIGTIVPAGVDSIVLDSVPAGTIPALFYSKSSGGKTDTIKVADPVKSYAVTRIENPAWSHSQKIGFNTTASGAGVNGNVENFPVLVRLNNNNFNFTQARPDGEDLMFTGSGNKLLPREIEHWDAAAANAAVWVRLDTIYGNSSDQSITMYWGASASSATILSNGAAVFDTADGYQGVWHLGDAEDDSIRDATENRYHGGSPENARPVAVNGMIGLCRRFDGVDDYITMPNTAGGKVNFSQDGYYTISAWVFIDSFTDAYLPQVIIAKGYEQYFLRTINYQNEIPFWEFSEYDEGIGWQSSFGTAKSGQWFLITGVRQGKNQYLYCNGAVVDSVAGVWPETTRNTSNDLSLGSFLQKVTVPSDEGYSFLRGSIDEVRVISAAQSPDWVRLCYMNQCADDRLVVFK